jgi:hypothetical protein
MYFFIVSENFFTLLLHCSSVLFNPAEFKYIYFIIIQSFDVDEHLLLMSMTSCLFLMKDFCKICLSLSFCFIHFGCDFLPVILSVFSDHVGLNDVFFFDKICSFHLAKQQQTKFLWISLNFNAKESCDKIFSFCIKIISSLWKKIIKN